MYTEKDISLRHVVVVVLTTADQFVLGPLAWVARFSYWLECCLDG